MKRICIALSSYVACTRVPVVMAASQHKHIFLTIPCITTKIQRLYSSDFFERTHPATITFGSIGSSGGLADGIAKLMRWCRRPYAMLFSLAFRAM